MDRTVASLSEQFAMKDFGFPSTFLNVQIRRTSTGLFLSQEHYARRLIQHHGMENSNPTKTPLSPKFYPSAEGESLADPMPFHALIGSLQYLTLTQPDITYSINQLSQFIQCPTVVHLQAARRILRYLNGSAALGLPLNATDTTRLVTFADADWAACPTTRRSTTGYAVYLGSTLISWRSKKQPTVARSSTEAEYRAMAYAVAETNWLSSLARELHISLSRPLLVCCDNLGATYLAANPIQHNRTKHMDIDYILSANKFTPVMSSSSMYLRKTNVLTSSPRTLVAPLLLLNAPISRSGMSMSLRRRNNEAFIASLLQPPSSHFVINSYTGGYSSGGYSSGSYSSGSNTCQSVISAPVDVSPTTNISTLAKVGFLMNWLADNCTACAGSGGRCGYDGSDKLVCFFPSGVRATTCGNGRKLGTKIAIGVGTGTGFMAMMSIVFFVVYTRHRKKYAQMSVAWRGISSMFSSQTDFGKGSFSYGVPIFDYEELEKATNHFDCAAELGNGGFGKVFKGKLRDGRVVAVKRLYEQNYSGVEQFMNEVDILARLRHPNLISLYGCTSRQSSMLLLVYEYIPNGTVSDHIHRKLAKPGLPPWLTRLNIAVETASALVYLHASDIVHRDLKTNNILLDENFTVKVADFGLSRLFPLDVTHISTAPQGTPGYVDPEYHQCYQLTEKSDVYSFGVVLIELISSLPAVDIMRRRQEINLSALAINKMQANALHELVDANLGFQSDDRTREMITAVAELAFRCLQPQHDDRPSMQEVLRTLKQIQKLGQGNVKAEEGDDPSDDSALLKDDSRSFSPDSVTGKWDSMSSSSVTHTASAQLSSR
ncbi:hypothetical protein MLD38_024004 [Melastoma candidum]|uniref:Uncharacterized protein n=1 Tax=Melastoma candidum TaxID=119954 RepID=A0ACB9NRZ8_9MYRT|nr:hypothetical protein MLD38_024004 [Melastoma candidum]